MKKLKSLAGIVFAGALGLAALGDSLVTTSVSLTWDPSPSPEVTGYNLFVGDATRHYTNSINVGNAVNYTVPGLRPGVSYFFTVTAYNSDGLESVPCNEVQYTPTGGPIPKPPSDSRFVDY